MSHSNLLYFLKCLFHVASVLNAHYLVLNSILSLFQSRVFEINTARDVSNYEIFNYQSLKLKKQIFEFINSTLVIRNTTNCLTIETGPCAKRKIQTKNLLLLDCIPFNSDSELARSEAYHL